MKYYVFIDESGDHGLKNIDKNFPVFVLCGLVFSEDQFKQFDTRMNLLKKQLWNSTDVIFHSRDIRKCEKEFQILFDLTKKEYFYAEVNSIIESSDFKVIIVERRGKVEDDELLRHYNEVYSLGTGYVEPKRIHAYSTRFKFKAKSDNLNGLQLADLIAYPIARHIIEPKRVNLSFEIVNKKFYMKNGKRYGLKEFP